MNCEFCGNDPCTCDRDDYNPCDVDADTWSEIYAKNPDLLDLDQSP